jgi:hypothetical protein
MTAENSDAKKNAGSRAQSAANNAAMATVAQVLILVKSNISPRMARASIIKVIRANTGNQHQKKTLKNLDRSAGM